MTMRNTKEKSKQRSILKENRALGLSAAAAAAGVTAALAESASGGTLNTNLLVNGGFETVNTGISSGYGAGDVLVNGGWLTAPSGGSVFAYNYAQNYDQRDGNIVPPGNDFSSATDYFHSLWLGNYPVDPTSEQNAVQAIDLSGGATGTAILGGGATYDVSGYFSNYVGETARGQIRLEFFDGDPGGGGNLIGSAVPFADTTLNEWTQVGGTGPIPSNAQFARLTLEQDPLSISSGVEADVYVDNISFQVAPEPSGVSLALLGALILAFFRRWRRR